MPAMKMPGINFFQHWKSSLVFVWPLFFVLYMSTSVVSRNGCTLTVIASVMQRAAFSSSVWMRRVQRHRTLRPVFFPLMCVWTREVLSQIC